MSLARDLTIEPQPAAVVSGPPFAEVPRTPVGHFVLCLYDAVFHLINHIRRLNEVTGTPLEAALERFPFLGEYFSEMREQMPDDLTWGDAAVWWRESISAWEAECPMRLPLVDLAAHPGVGYGGRLAFMAAGIVEEDSRFGTVIADLHAPLSHRRPTLELLGQIVSNGPVPGEGDAWATCRALIEDGFLVTTDRDAPRSEWVLRVPPLLWDAARNELGDSREHAATWWRLTPVAALPQCADLVQTPDLLARSARLPLLAAGRARTVVLRSGPGAEPGRRSALLRARWTAARSRSTARRWTPTITRGCSGRSARCARLPGDQLRPFTGTKRRSVGAGRLHRADRRAARARRRTRRARGRTRGHAGADAAARRTARNLVARRALDGRPVDDLPRLPSAFNWRAASSAGPRRWRRRTPASTGATPCAWATCRRRPARSIASCSIRSPIALMRTARGATWWPARRRG